MHSVLKAAITDALQSLRITDIDFSVEHPADLSHGDYASNVALVAAKKAGSNPREFAEKIKEKLDGTIEYVATIEIAGPGFLNFTLQRTFFVQEIMRAQDRGEKWGHHTAWKGRKVMVEYTDANPFKEFHVGHLFTNTVGEAIARLCIMGGAEVRRVSYQGDVGIHVACAMWGMQNLGFAGVRDFSAAELGKAYALGARAYREDEEAAATIRTINKAVYERADETINALYDQGRKVSLAYFETIYELLDTHFDHYFFESEAAPLGKDIVLGNPDIFPESDGARVFRGEEHGLHTRVFLNSDGLPTYEAKELALAKIKYDTFPYDHSIVSTANEITEYFKVLKMAMHFVYPELAERTEHIGHGTVRLTSGKMSSRTGEVIAAIGFISDVAHAVTEKMRATGTDSPDPEVVHSVALSAIKYATLKTNILQNSTFDEERALSFEGDSGPYLQYTHARIVSVLEKARAAGITPSITSVPDVPYVLEKLLYRFPAIVERALLERAPHYVVGFLIELAGEFNTFYASERIADPEDIYAPYKAALADAVRQTLHNGLWVLGIKAPTHM